MKKNENYKGKLKDLQDEIFDLKDEIDDLEDELKKIDSIPYNERERIREEIMDELEQKKCECEQKEEAIIRFASPDPFEHTS